MTGPGSADLERYSGMPVISPGLSSLGNNSTWTPVWRDERSYTVSTNLTKVAGRHEIRSGFDFVRLRLTHWQPEVGNPRGDLSFGGGITGTPGYAGVGGWNGYAAFLLGEMSSYGKSVQFEELSGRENQYGLYVADRWQVNEKLTLNLGLRYEYYPLMTRQDRGIELLDVNTFNVRLGGLGGNPKDLGIDVSKTLFAPRVGAAYRLNERTVFRAGYGKTFTPLPWSRPMRGRFPLTIAYSDAGVERLHPLRQCRERDPRRAEPGHRQRQRSAPARRGHDVARPRTISSRGATQSWNAFVERRLPLDVAVSVGYVGTRTDGQYASRNLNYAESGGNANRQLFAQAGTAAINVLAASARSKYHSLQVAVNRPFKNGILLKGAYTLSKAMNEVDDDGGGYTWAMPSQFSRNYALAGYDRPHMLQMGFVYELPFARNSDNPVALVVKDWQINGIASWLSGTPFTIGGDNGLLQQSGGSQTINATGDPEPGFGEAGPNEQWYDPAAFSQPGNAWGNTGRNQFRGPGNWNLDFSLFRTIPFGHYRVEIRAESQNVFNHAQWGNPVTGFTDPNFMRIRTLARAPRTVQLGMRFTF